VRSKFAMAWGLATGRTGREPESVEEYAETVEGEPSPAYRDYQAFHRAFPGEESPARMNQVSGNRSAHEELVRSLRSFARACPRRSLSCYALRGVTRSSR